jgi:MerR family transcriptional regulator, copper efflux regulator
MSASTSHHWLKIGEVATISGLPVKTIRYYEDLGLLAPIVERTNSGYRLYQAIAVSRFNASRN